MIRNLLFDLGGVIMDIEKSRCIAAFERLGMTDAREFFGDYSQKGPFMALEEGAISETEFREKIRSLIDHPVCDDQIDEAFCRFLTGIPRHRLDTLEKLRGRYGIYMLSNTNPIMWNTTIAREFKKCGKCREDYFDGMVTSFEAKAAKPDGKIFSYTIRHLDIDPEETLFLDDSMQNLSAAEQYGFKTAHVRHGSEFYPLLQSLGLA